MTVVNDSAERAVRLSSNFVTSSRNEDTFKDNVQIITKYRNDVPNLIIKNSLRNKIP